MNRNATLDPNAYIERLEAAQPDALTRMLQQATADEERLLRTYLGNERYNRMQALARGQDTVRGRRGPRGNVVVLHGIMGAELTALQGHEPVAEKVSLRQIWVRYARLILGDIRYLRLDSTGTKELEEAYQIAATGIMKNHYGVQLLSLSKHWNVRAFWYDWRKDLNAAARELHLKLVEWFDQEPVHLVAHSMGGLVARTFIANYEGHWKEMWDEEDGGKRGGRLLMLGTPNHGSFAVPQIITGVESTVRKLARLDLRHKLDDLLEIVNTFVGTYQMLPSPLVEKAYERLYKAETYRNSGVSQNHLEHAREHHDRLSKVVDPKRMIYIAGCNQPTYSGITNWERFLDQNPKEARKAYAVTLDGDGRVPHALGLLKNKSGKAIPTYYVEEGHGDLPQNAQVLSAFDDLLERGATRRLPQEAIKRISRGKEEEEARRRMEAVEAENDREEARIEAYRSLSRRRLRTSDPEAVPDLVTTDGRITGEMLTRGFLSSSMPTTSRSSRVGVPFAPPQLTVRVVCAGIQTTDFLSDTDPPVDALSVGHYRNVKPVHAELALDKALSTALSDGREPAESELLITQLSERGTIRGDLGQPFILPDYRDRSSGGTRRVVAIAGMGDPGRFGVPELTVLVRELAWALGRMGKQHLASVLIGAGNGNLRIQEAVPAWIRGFKHALTGVAEEGTCMRQLTFVEYSPTRAIEIDAAMRRVQRELDPERMVLHYTAFSVKKIAALKEQDRECRRQELKREIDRLEEGGDPQQDAQEQPEPTRLTVTLEENTYRFGAITENASVPEREVEIDRKLIDQANDRLAQEWTPEKQRDHGRLLERLLIPQDLRSHLTGSAPLVLLLDRNTARIHWEMVAQPETSASMDRSTEDPDTAEQSSGRISDKSFFLGINRGFTRQLRTTFAPPPEPPPPARRLLRVLVVADPAADAPLPGAEEEGIEVAELFERYNTLHTSRQNGAEDKPPTSENRVEVVRLFGPLEATRLNVLSELTLRSYDVLHFAGHCFYDKKDPESSGWIFSNEEVLSARELRRIDRVPQFVFSNACESGITPEAALTRTAALAPSFAEAFFLRGVTNFVCTAWPIDDIAARTFARVLYAKLLGIPGEPVEEGSTSSREDPQEMYRAMRAARRAIMDTPGGFQTWGAYQHYGNPYYRFFLPTPADTSVERTEAKPIAESASKAEVRSKGEPSSNGEPSSTDAPRETEKKAEKKKAGRGKKRAK